MEELDENDLILGLQYLVEWGLSQATIQKFEENQITLKLMPDIKDPELKELIPNIKERIMYKVGLEKLQNVIHDTASEDTISLNSDTSAPSSPASCSNEPTCSKQKSNEINIASILNDNNNGKLVLARLKSGNKLDANLRTHLTKSIVEWYLKHYECMKKEDFVVVAEAIHRFIPTELKETYYIPGIKYRNKYIPARGKLIDRYNNQRRLLKREGVFGLKRKLDVEVEEEIVEKEDAVIWLKYNKEPFSEVKEKWLETRKYRVETDYKNAKNNLQDILKKYPLLKQSFGFQLINLDFEYRYPDKDILLFEKFPDFLQKAVFMNDVKVFQDLKNIFDNTINEDTKIFIALSFLCGKLVPTVGRSEKRKDEKFETDSADKKYIKPTILESRDSLILHVKAESDVQNCLTKRRDAHLKKGLTCQPVVICVGSDIENFSNFYINFDDVTYHLESLLKAVDICFKAFHVFDIQYPRESIQPWMFIQHYFYGINTPQDRKFPNVATLIADLL